jgi:hypothetical protein
LAASEAKGIRIMENGIGVIVLAAGDHYGAGFLTTVPTVLREQLKMAATMAPRHRIYTVVTHEWRHRLEDPLWFLPRSNVVSQPEGIGTAHGILLALLRISKRDPDASIVILPSTQLARTPIEGSFLDSLRSAAIDVSSEPWNVIRLSVDPYPPDAHIVVGRTDALLKLFDPEMVSVMQEIDERAPDIRADPIVAADFLERLSLPHLDFYRHVLVGEQHHLVQGNLALDMRESL